MKKQYNVRTSYTAAIPRGSRNGAGGGFRRTVVVGSSGSGSVDLSSKLDVSVFDDLFEKVNLGTAAAPVYAIRAKYGLYSDNFLSALGPNAEGGGSGGGATALSDLNDVSLSSGLATGDLLVYDGTHWVNTPQSLLKPDLAGYATEAWVRSQGYASASALSAHAGDRTIHITSSEREKWDKTATDFAAIVGEDVNGVIDKWEEVVAFLDTYTEADTLANLLSNKVDKTTSVTAGTGLSGGGALSKSVTLSLAASGVAAGSYAKVTVDVYGRVTEGTTLTANDIPMIPISRVAGLQESLAGKLDKSVFDDLFEKVNLGTAAAPKYAIRAKYGLYSDDFLSALGPNAEGGGGGGSSYDRLDSWADYTSEKSGWVLSAALGHDLDTRVKSLEAGSALNISTGGTGNVVTAIGKSGNMLTVTKGLTALTADAAAATYATKLGVSGTQIGTYVNGKLGNLITVPYATNADTVDNIHAKNLGQGYDGLGIDADVTASFPYIYGGKLYAAKNVPYTYYAFLHFGTGKYFCQLNAYANQLKFRATSEDNYTPEWKTVAFTDSNVASATKLAASRRLWGNAFDGTGNVDGDITFAAGAGDRRLKITTGGQINFTVATGGWAWGLNTMKRDGTTELGAIGAFGDSDAVSYWFMGGTYSSPKMVVTAAGNAGFGVTAPEKKVHLAGDLLATSSGRTKIITRGGNVSASLYSAGDTGRRGLYDETMNLWTIGCDGNAVFTSFNKFGVGTESPAYPLDVVGHVRTTGSFISAADNGLRLTYGSYGSIIRHDGNDLWILLTDKGNNLGNFNNHRPFRINLSTGMVTLGQVLHVVDYGNVGIGTQAPGHKLAVEGTGYFSSTLTVGAGLIASYTAGSWISMATRSNVIRSATNNSDSSAHALFRLKDSSGNAICFGGLGSMIGFYGFSAANIANNTNASAWRTAWNVATGELMHNSALSVTGALKCSSTIYGKVGIWADGYVSALGQNTDSDERLKRHIEDIRLAVKDIAAAPSWRYAWRSRGTVDVGSTAQYWQRLVPELAHERPDTKCLGLDYGKAALLSAVSVARGLLSVESRVKILERENIRLKQEVEQLKRTA